MTDSGPLTPAQRRARSNAALLEQGGSLLNCRLSPAATAALAYLVESGMAKTGAVEAALLALARINGAASR
ncbi:MAG: hypothetical protein ABTR92_19660 [Candidatus Accumulibacter phosphatis]